MLSVNSLADTPDAIRPDERRDELILMLYGSIAALRDLEAMHEQGKKPRAGSYALLHDSVEMQPWIYAKRIVDLVRDNPVMYDETYRALRYSQEPTLVKLAERIKAERAQGAA